MTRSISRSRLLQEAHVAATPGVDFDPVDGKHFIRFSYAGSQDEMREAVTRIGEVAEALMSFRPSERQRARAGIHSPGSGIWIPGSRLRRAPE